MENRRRAWLQFASKADPIRICQLQTNTRNTDGVVAIVRKPHSKYPKKAMLTYCSITDFNIIVSVLSMFILLIKAVLFIMHMWIPLVSLIINMIVTALWCVSVYGQAGPDYSDPEHPSKVAWYITKSCSYAEASGNKHNCNMAKGSFAASILML